MMFEQLLAHHVGPIHMRYPRDHPSQTMYRGLCAPHSCFAACRPSAGKPRLPGLAQSAGRHTACALGPYRHNHGHGQLRLCGVLRPALRRQQLGQLPERACGLARRNIRPQFRCTGRLVRRVAK